MEKEKSNICGIKYEDSLEYLKTVMKKLNTNSFIKEGTLKHKKLYLGSKMINRQRYMIYQYVNSLGKVLSSGFQFEGEK